MNILPAIPLHSGSLRWEQLLPMFALAALCLMPRPVSGQASAPAADPLAVVRQAEQDRIGAMALAAPSVVAVIEASGAGGGSGVVITPDGYGLTNFHVVAPLLDTREGLGGMSDGKVYQLKVLGVDPTGDLAMFKLEPEPISDVTAPEPGDPGAGEAGKAAPSGESFAKRVTTRSSTRPASQPAGTGPFKPAILGDSDRVALGDPVFAMGNPFLLAEDYTPTTTFGIVSGVHRYQFGADGRSLVYTDCIQVDASINPGNSGGPLFDLQGRLIGINGRASFEQRGRVNVGLAYAISINQAKRFIPALRAGLLIEHGLLGATTVDLGYRRVVFEKMLDPSPAAAAGIQVGDRLLEFGGQPMHSANQFLNFLGTYPVGWPVQVVYEHDGQPITRTVRLERLPVEVKFEPDAELNRSETQRILDAARAAMGTWPKGAGLHWVAQRQIQAAQMHTLDATESADGAGQVKVKDAQGQVVRELQYNGRTAQVREAGKEWAAASPQETALANLWITARRAIIDSGNPDTLKAWRVVGGDDFRGRVADLLEYNSQTSPLRVAIDPQTHLPVRLFWVSSEAPSPKNPSIELELEDYQDTDGLKLPRQMTTYVGGALAGIDIVTSYGLERAQ